MTLLSARDLAVVPPGSAEPSVQGISLSIDRGEWIAVTGPNGGGKTSLLLGLAGLWPSRGGLELRGRSFGPDADPAWRRGVAVILQDPSSQILTSSVFDEVAFSLRNLGHPEAEVRRRVGVWGERLGLTGDLARDPSRLSAGRQQLTLAAAALAGEPDLLLADEATAHLDLQSRERVLEAVSREVSRGMAAVWVTQHASELGAAKRTLLIGQPFLPPTRPRPDGRGSRETGTLLRLRVAALGNAEGPLVTTANPMEIAVGRTGVVGLVGPNGAGKSVLILAAAGLAAPGQVAVEWEVRPEPPPIAALQFPEQQIFQESVADELAFAAVARGVPRTAALDRAGTLLEGLGLDPASLLRRKTWGLATGERRLVEIVAALIAPACLYLLDEPTAGLDPTRRAALQEVVRRISLRAPLLVATQDRDWLLELHATLHELGRVGRTAHPDLKTH